MSDSQKVLIGLVGGLLLLPGARTVLADSSGTPYQAIVDRNVFGLKPPPPPPPDPGSIKPPPPKITLNGITTLMGKKRALLKLTPPAKPGEPAKEQSYMLAVGQRDGDIEVIQIEEKLGQVTVDDFGTITNLTFDKDGPKMASSPPPGAPGAPAAPAAGGIPLPAPGGANPLPSLRTIPTRTLRSPSGAPGQPSAPGSDAAGMPTGTPTGGGTASATATGQMSLEDQNAIASQRTPEESVLLYEANRLKNEELRAAGYKIPPMPQHPLLRGQAPQ